MLEGDCPCNGSENETHGEKIEFTSKNLSLLKAIYPTNRSVDKMRER